MEIKITKAKNGYILECEDYCNWLLVYEDENVESAFLNICRDMQEIFGLLGSRYDKKRIYHIEAPGDKHEDWTEEHSKIIFGGDEWR